MRSSDGKLYWYLELLFKFQMCGSFQCINESVAGEAEFQSKLASGVGGN